MFVIWHGHSTQVNLSKLLHMQMMLDLFDCRNRHLIVTSDSTW